MPLINKHLTKCHLLLFFVLLYFLDTSCTKQEAPPPASQARRYPVEVEEAKYADLPVYINAIGTLLPSSTIHVFPRVNGELLNIHFQRGDFVKKGQLLFSIDPRPYEANLQKAKANRSKDLASLEYAQKKVSTYSDLTKKEYFARISFEEFKQNVKIFQAAVQEDTGDIELAKLNLGYTKIYSPIDGFIGNIMIYPGNLLTTTSEQPLTTIVQITPLECSFSVQEGHLNTIRAKQAEEFLKVTAFLPGEKAPFLEGNLCFIDNTINTATGTVQLLASFPNPEFKGWPGQFVCVQLLVEILQNQVVVPEEAIQISSSGTYVFVLKPEMTVEKRSVQVIKRSNSLAALEGIKVGEKVVTDGQINLYADALVFIHQPAPLSVEGIPQ